jgi:hypothetical protein
MKRRAEKPIIRPDNSDEQVTPKRRSKTMMLGLIASGGAVAAARIGAASVAGLGAVAVDDLAIKPLLGGDDYLALASGPDNRSKGPGPVTAPRGGNDRSGARQQAAPNVVQRQQQMAPPPPPPPHAAAAQNFAPPPPPPNVARSTARENTGGQRAAQMNAGAAAVVQPPAPARVDRSAGMRGGNAAPVLPMAGQAFNGPGSQGAQAAQHAQREASAAARRAQMPLNTGAQAAAAANAAGREHSLAARASQLAQPREASGARQAALGQGFVPPQGAPLAREATGNRGANFAREATGNRGANFAQGNLGIPGATQAHEASAMRGATQAHEASAMRGATQAHEATGMRGGSVTNVAGVQIGREATGANRQQNATFQPLIPGTNLSNNLSQGHEASATIRQPTPGTLSQGHEASGSIRQQTPGIVSQGHEASATIRQQTPGAGAVTGIGGERTGRSNQSITGAELTGRANQSITGRELTGHSNQSITVSPQGVVSPTVSGREGSQTGNQTNANVVSPTQLGVGIQQPSVVGREQSTHAQQGETSAQRSQTIGSRVVETSIGQQPIVVQQPGQVTAQQGLGAVPVNSGFLPPEFFPAPGVVTPAEFVPAPGAVPPPQFVPAAGSFPPPEFVPGAGGFPPPEFVPAAGGFPPPQPGPFFAPPPQQGAFFGPPPAQGPFFGPPPQGPNVAAFPPAEVAGVQVFGPPILTMPAAEAVSGAFGGGITPEEVRLLSPVEIEELAGARGLNIEQIQPMLEFELPIEAEVAGGEAFTPMIAEAPAPIAKIERPVEVAGIQAVAQPVAQRPAPFVAAQGRPPVNVLPATGGSPVGIPSGLLATGFSTLIGAGMYLRSLGKRKR